MWRGAATGAWSSGLRLSTEDPADPEEGTPLSIDAGADADQDRADQRIQRDAEAELRFQIRVLIRVERRAVLHPQAGEHRSAEKVGQPADAPQSAEREHRVVIAAELAHAVGVQPVGVAWR